MTEPGRKAEDGAPTCSATRQAHVELELRMQRWTEAACVVALLVVAATGLALVLTGDRAEQVTTGEIFLTATVSGALGHLVARVRVRRARHKR